MNEIPTTAWRPQLSDTMSIPISLSDAPVSCVGNASGLSPYQPNEGTFGEAQVRAAVSEAKRKVCEAPSDDANVLLALLSFMSPSHNFTINFLHRGANTRKRWNTEGGIDQFDALKAGLAFELKSVLADLRKLQVALEELSMCSAVSTNPDGAYTVDQAVAQRTRESLSRHVDDWSSQALIVSYMAFPWRYLEPV